jgi:hypothetical protein
MRLHLYFENTEELLARINPPIKAISLSEKIFRIGKQHYEVMDFVYDVRFGGYRVSVTDVKFTNVIDCNEFDIVEV